MFKKRSWLKRRKDQPNIPYQLSTGFKYAMQVAQEWMEEENDPAKKIALLNFIMQAIREDLKSTTLATIFYRKEHFQEYNRIPFFPSECFDQHGKRIPSYSVISQIPKTIKLSNDCVVAVPWNRKQRFCHSIKQLYNMPFLYQETNHRSMFYRPINVCHVHSENHSIGAGIGHRKGKIYAVEVDITTSFPHIYGDDLYWYNAHTEQSIGKVYDFRVSILYELAKLKFEIQQPLLVSKGELTERGAIANP